MGVVLPALRSFSLATRILRIRKPSETSRGRRAVGRGCEGPFLRQTDFNGVILHRFVYRPFPRQHHWSCDSDREECSIHFHYF